MSGAELIAAERRRQIEEECRTAEHDADHDAGELVYAARAYLRAHDWRRQFRSGNDVIKRYVLADNLWPWSPADFKPRSDVDDLVRAGALIAAELDRITAGGRR